MNEATFEEFFFIPSLNPIYGPPCVRFLKYNNIITIIFHQFRRFFAINKNEIRNVAHYRYITYVPITYHIINNNTLPIAFRVCNIYLSRTKRVHIRYNTSYYYNIIYTKCFPFPRISHSHETVSGAVAACSSRISCIITGDGYCATMTNETMVSPR